MTTGNRRSGGGRGEGNIIVLGAGPAGLMAADRLAEAGHRVTVVEAADHVGGMAGSFEVAGQRVDYGSHRLHPASPAALLEQLHELLGDDLQVRPRLGRLHLEHRWVGFPLRATELMGALPPSLTARLVADSARTSIRSSQNVSDPESFEDAVTARLGPTVTSRFYGPYARKLYGSEPDQLDAELARRRVSVSSPGAVVRRMLKASRPSGRQFLYPRLGYGQIAERLAERARSAGATIHLGEPVNAVANSNGRVRVDTDYRSLEGDLALSSIPITTLARLLQSPPPAEIQNALSSLRTRAMLLVYVVLDRTRYTEFDAHYLPGPETRVARLSEPKNYRDGPDPTGRTVLCAEIPCWPDEDIRLRHPDELARMVMADLASVGLPTAEPVGAETRFLPSVYPIYDLNGRTARSVVDRWSQSLDRVVPIGRQGLRAIDNLHHVLAIGTAAASAVGAEGTFDRDRWARDLSEFNDHVVED